MSRTFKKFTLKDQKKASREHHELEKETTSHDLSGDYPLDEAEADSILEKMRAEEKHLEEIDRLNACIQDLEGKLNERNTSVAMALKEIGSIRDRLVNDLPDEILKTADSIVRDAIREKLPEIVKKRIDDAISHDGGSKFYAAPSSAKKIDSRVITIDEALPENILVHEDSNGGRHVIELEESM